MGSYCLQVYFREQDATPFETLILGRTSEINCRTVFKPLLVELKIADFNKDVWCEIMRINGF